MSVMEKLEELEARIEELEGRWHRLEQYIENPRGEPLLELRRSLRFRKHNGPECSNENEKCRQNGDVS